MVTFVMEIYVPNFVVVSAERFDSGDAWILVFIE